MNWNIVNGRNHVSNVLVSIICYVYNHENYIKDALNSFLGQKVDFNYEIILRDDCSTDSSALIIQEYEKKYPNLIHGIYETENQYAKGVREFHRKTKAASKGKYIALCEGDDCWLDGNKLQIQVDYMEQHEECMMSAHNAVMVNCLDGQIQTMNPYLEEKDLTPCELIMQYRGNLPTASILIRREVFAFPSFFGEIGVGDIPIQFYCMTKGTIHYTDRIMSLYRYAHEGSWTRRTLEDEKHKIIHYIKMIQFFDCYNSYTKYIYFDCLKKKSRSYMEVILSVCDKMTLEEFDSICMKYNEETSHQYEKYFKKLYQIFHQKKDMFFVDKKVKEFMERFPVIVIFGAGYYGKRLASQLNHCNLDFNGFVVSDGKSVSEEINGKPVWNLKDVPYKAEEMGIIVAVDDRNWEELESLFENNRQIQYRYLFEVLEEIKR